jgi:hypothetical protein
MENMSRKMCRQLQPATKRNGVSVRLEGPDNLIRQRFSEPSYLQPFHVLESIAWWLLPNHKHRHTSRCAAAFVIAIAR